MRNCKTGGRSERCGMARVPILLLAASAALIVASFARPSWAQVAGTPELQVARLGHTATVLRDGRMSDDLPFRQERRGAVFVWQIFACMSRVLY